MIGLFVFLAEAILESGGSAAPTKSAPLNNPFGNNTPFQINNNIPPPSNLASLESQFPQSQFVGGTYNSDVVNNPIVQAQREMAQGQAIQQQIAIQIATGKTNVTSPTGTPVQIRAPSGSTKSFL